MVKDAVALQCFLQFFCRMHNMLSRPIWTMESQFDWDQVKRKKNKFTRTVWLDMLFIDINVCKLSKVQRFLTFTTFLPRCYCCCFCFYFFSCGYSTEKSSISRHFIKQIQHWVRLWWQLTVLTFNTVDVEYVMFGFLNIGHSTYVIIGCPNVFHVIWNRVCYLYATRAYFNFGYL